MDKNNSYSVLYQKYRPALFKQVIGQTQVVKVLENAVATKKLANAYIFSGLHGIGKTTLARIFAKAVNCLQNQNGDACDQCDHCLLINNKKAIDIVEIDAASNNGVENVRNIIENANYLPSVLSYKIYIIDEAHMISTAGWNAFLKTLENANNHVIFIFATTEIEKIPTTILSRCQIYNLTPLNNEQLMDLIKRIISNENIKIDEDACQLLIELAKGSARDLLSNIEHLRQINNQAIDVDLINQAYCLTNKKQAFSLLLHALDNDEASMIKELTTLLDAGINLNELAKTLLGLSLDLYLYLTLKNQNYIHPSNYQLFKDAKLDQLNLTNIKLLVNKLSWLLPELHKSTDPTLLFESTLITYQLTNQLNLNQQVVTQEESPVSFNKQQLVKQIPVSPVDNNEIVLASGSPLPNESLASNSNPTNKPATIHDPYLESFILNPNEPVKIDEQTNAQLQTRINSLDESWLNEKLPDLSQVFTTTEVTNELIRTVTKDDANHDPIETIQEVSTTIIENNPNNNQVTSETPILTNELKAPVSENPLNKKANSDSINQEVTSNKPITNNWSIPASFSDEQFFSFATYQLNNQLNKELVNQDKKIIDEIINDPTKKFVLLINILKLQDKLLIVNNHFMLFQASNQFNANSFNELASQQELLSEIKLAFHDGYYFHAVPKSAIKKLFEYSKTHQVDLVAYDADIKALDHLDPNALNIKEWTDKMLFKEEDKKVNE